MKILRAPGQIGSGDLQTGVSGNDKRENQDIETTSGLPNLWVRRVVDMFTRSSSSDPIFSQENEHVSIHEPSRGTRW